MALQRRLGGDTGARLVVRGDGAHDVGVPALLLQQPHAPQRVLVGMLLVVEVVQEPGDAPLLLVLAVLAGVPAHGRFHTHAVPAQRVAGGVLTQEREGRLTIVRHGAAA